jgi:uncharacterized membrane protein (UPF0136 family)
MSFVASVFCIVGLVAVAGGVIGYRKAKSIASLVAGGVSGAALLGAAGLLFTGSQTAGLTVGTLACLALAGRFVPAYFRTRRMMPHGLMAVLSSVGLFAVLAAVVLT